MTIPTSRLHRKGSNAPAKMFIAIKTHGPEILTALGTENDSLRSIARQFGMTHTLLARALPVIAKFEVDIAQGHFDAVERHLFEPVGRDYKLMPFYKKLMGHANDPKPRKRRVAQGSGVPSAGPNASALTTPQPTSETSASAPTAKLAHTVEPDEFFDSASASSALLSKVNLAAAPSAPSKFESNLRAGAPIT
jgi:hypothetical protein